jgi:membrane protein
MDAEPSRLDRLKGRFEGSNTEQFVKTLMAMDVVNRGMLFAAVLFLCFVPFVIILSALAGRSAVDTFVRHLGLNHEAATDVSKLFEPASSTSSTLTGGAYVVFVLGGIAAAAAVQELYLHAFELKSRGMRELPRLVGWLAVLIASSAFSSWVGPALHDAGGPVLLGAIGLAALIAFWWFSIWFLLGGRISWRDSLPSAIATGVCWLGMVIVFSLVFSETVITSNKKYGPIGVTFGLLSYFIAIGVVLILGAVIGILWREARGAGQNGSPPDRGR